MVVCAPGVAAADSARDLYAGGGGCAEIALRVHSHAGEAGIVDGGDFEIRPKGDLSIRHSRGRVAAAEDRRPGVLGICRQGQCAQRKCRS